MAEASRVGAREVVGPSGRAGGRRLRSKSTGRHRRVLGPASALCAALCIVAVPALAQEAANDQDALDDAQRSLAREEYEAGVSAANQGRWEVAREHFQNAYDIVGLPEVLFNLAAAQVETGQLVQASESYRRFLRLSADMPGADSLRRHAEDFLEQVEPRLAQVQIAADGLLECDIVAIDDIEVAHAVVGRHLPSNPGSHRITVTRNDQLVGESSFDATEGERVDVAVSLRTDVRCRPRADVIGGPTGPTESDGGLLASPWFWVGVAAVAGAVATTAVVLSPADDGPQAYGQASVGQIVF